MNKPYYLQWHWGSLPDLEVPLRGRLGRLVALRWARSRAKPSRRLIAVLSSAPKRRRSGRRHVAPFARFRYKGNPAAGAAATAISSQR